MTRYRNPVLLFFLVWGLSWACSQKQAGNTLPKATSPENLIEIAERFYQERKTDSALHYHLTSIRQMDSLSASPLFQLNRIAQIYILHREPDSAGQYLDRVRSRLGANPDSLDPQYLRYQINLGNYMMGGYSPAADKGKQLLDSMEAIFLGVTRSALRSSQSDNESLGRAYGSLGVIQEYRKDRDKAYQYYKLCSQQFEEGNSNPDFLARVYPNLAKIHRDRGEYDLARDYYLKSYQILTKHFPPDYHFRTNTTSELGYAYYLYGDYNKAITYIDSAIQIFRRDSAWKDLAYSYQRLAVCLMEKGELSRAIGYFHKCIREFEKIEGWRAKLNRAGIHNNLAVAYVRKKNYAEAKHHFWKALNGYGDLYGHKQPFLGMMYRNLARAYEQLDKPDSAFVLYQTTVSLHETDPVQWQSDLALDYLYLADFYRKKEDFSRSLGYLEQGLELVTDKGVDEVYANFLQKKSEIYASKKDFPASLAYAQAAIAATSYAFDSASIDLNPPLEDLLVPDYLLSLLIHKGKVLQEYYVQSQDPAYQQLALQTFEHAQDLVDTIRLDYEASDSKLSLMGNLAPLYEASIDAAHQLYKLTGEKKYAEKAFLFAERGRAMVLYESLQAKKASRLALVPEKELNRLNDLHLDISFFQKQIRRQDPGPERDSLEEKVFELRRSYYSLKKELANAFPDYYAYKYNLDLPSPDAIQQYLTSRNASLVEYVWGDSLQFAICLNGEDIQVQRLDTDTSFAAMVDSIRHQLSVPPEGTEKNTFITLGQDLYSNLISPFAGYLKGERLIIIPDGALSLLPFEVLVDPSASEEEDPDFRELPYLFSQYKLSYAYASNLFLIDMGKGKGKNTTLAMAPTFEGLGEPDQRSAGMIARRRGGIGELKFTKEEARKVSDLTSGTLLTGTSATETAFKQKAGTYQVLHMATHGLVDDENPLYSQLVLAGDETNDGYLHTYEIFALDLNADLVVLSACNTGFGNFQRGEGVMSLARGFAHAGAPSIVMSLWPVDDEASSRLMVGFYEMLEEGHPKDVALSEARHQYLKTCKRYESHPYYWAGFVALGDMSPVEFRQSWW